MSSIKKNVFYNILLTLSTYIFGIILFPYTSRVLGVDIIGRLGFVENIISYFLLFSTLGVQTVGIREIAACGNDRAKRSKVFSSIVMLIFLLTIVALVVLIAMTVTIPQFFRLKNILFLGAITLFFSSFQIEWLYQGVENFKFITLRNLLIKILYVLSVFVLVKKSDDYMIFYGLTTLSFVLNATINIISSKRFVDFKISFNDTFRFAKPIFSLGLYRMMLNMYTTVNVVLLGLFCTETEVGYYSTAIKLVLIITGVISALTSVMLPRMSSLLSENNLTQFQDNINKTIEIVIVIAFPLLIGGIVHAPHIIHILAGGDFDGAISPMRLIMPNILINGIAQVMVIQVLLPMRKDNVVMRSSFFAAIVAITINLLLVPKTGAVGSAIVYMAAEFIGDFLCLYYVIKHQLARFPVKCLCKQVILSVPYFIICVVFYKLFTNDWCSLLLSMVICSIYFFTTHVIIYRNSVISKIVRPIIRMN